METFALHRLSFETIAALQRSIVGWADSPTHSQKASCHPSQSIRQDAQHRRAYSMNMRGALLDTQPLRTSGAFRRLWFGTSMQTIGQRIVSIAVIFQVWELTHNPFWVGFVGLVHAAPMILFGLVGGVIADTVDRRRVVLVTTIGALIASMALALQAIIEVNSLALLLVLLCIQTSISSVGRPSRRAFIPRLLPKNQVSAGLSLMHISSQIAMLLGPALGGLIISQMGLKFCYIVEACAFCTAIYGVARLPTMRPDKVGTPRAGILAEIVDGVSFIAQRPVLSGSFLSDLASTFLAMPMALFPALNELRFSGNPETLGLLFSAVAAGGVISAALSGIFTRSHRLGRVQLVAALTWGCSLAALGVLNGLGATLILLAIAGAADTVAVVSRGTVLQLATPDRFRGRISSVEQIVGIAGPDLGNFRAGIVASLLSPVTALVAGGALCAAATLAIATAYPSLRNFSSKDEIDDANDVVLTDLDPRPVPPAVE